jgi:glutathione peroxidase
MSNDTITSIYDFTVNQLDGTPDSMASFRGKVLLIVNTASECGFTPQYKGLEEIYQKYHDQGFEVLGFPCNQFGAQEPGTNQDIKNFCSANYGVKFPLFAKIEVNGENTHPLYRFLKEARRGLLGTQRIKWNFTKFLVERDGVPLKRYSPQDKPENIARDIERLLAK